MLPVVLGAISLASSLFGKKKAPAPVYQKPIDWQEEQKKAISGNLANFGDASQLSERTNTFAQGEASRLMEMALPGWSKLQGTLSNQAQSLLTNPYDVPPEVAQNLARQAAERGISSGARGQFSDFSYLRDFGLNSLQMGQQRINQAQGIASMLASTAPRVNPMSPISMFINPTQVAAATQQQNAANQQVGQQAANAQASASNYNNQAIWNGVGAMAGSLDWGSIFGTGSSTSNASKIGSTVGNVAGGLFG